jgi:hypothetical protein
MIKQLIESIFGKSQTPTNVLIAPSGQAKRADKCAKCERLPEAWEEPFMIYGETVCEDCFWDESYDQVHNH